MRHDSLLRITLEGQIQGKKVYGRPRTVFLVCLLKTEKGISYEKTRGQSNLTKSASRGAHSPVRGHPRGSKVVPLNSWGRVSY